jgi:hypothetical protein
LIPLWAWPRLIRYTLRRRWRPRRPPPPPDLSDADLDFFFGGTEAVERRLANPAFRFFSPSDFGGSALHARLLTDCDSIRAHRLELLGQTVDLGNPIAWRRDFNTGYEWPREHISRLKLVTREGDVKAPWELSRFHHGLILALGYAATGDERYPREWRAQFESWRADNPPEFGPNWGNAMEAAIRAVNWIAAFDFLRPAFDRATGESVLKALIQHGRFIASHLEEYWPPTNHILSNYCGLIWLGLYLMPPDLTGFKNLSGLEAKRWLALGLRGLERQLQIQILPDGASYEASTGYHRFVTEMVTSTVKLCELNDVWIPPSVKNTALKMVEVVEGLRKPDGSLPLFGDEDGGQWLPNFRNVSPDFESLSRKNGWAPFPHAGWFIFRNGDEYLAIRAGDNGQGGWGGHAHNDALSFEYGIGKRNFLIDPGAFAYTADPEARNLFRSTAYHNTLRVDGQEISRIPPGELFRLENDAKVRVRVESESLEGEHSGYRRIGVMHRRRFEKQASGWLIRDTVTGSGAHKLEWFFHFAPECRLKAEGLKVETQFADSPNITLAPNLQSPISNLQTGWVSPTYGRRENAPVVAYSMAAKLPVTVTFIIIKL